MNTIYLNGNYYTEADLVKAVSLYESATNKSIAKPGFQTLPSELQYDILKTTPMYKRIAKSTYDHSTFIRQFCEAPITAKEALFYVKNAVKEFCTYVDEPNRFIVKIYSHNYMNRNDINYYVEEHSINICDDKIFYYNNNYKTNPFSIIIDVKLSSSSLYFP